MNHDYLYGVIPLKNGIKRDGNNVHIPNFLYRLIAISKWAKKKTMVGYKFLCKNKNPLLHYPQFFNGIVLVNFQQLYDRLYIYT